MLYCKRCMSLLKDESVTICLCGNKKLRQPLVNDAVFLTTAEAFKSWTIEQFLQEQEIPFIKQGDGLSVNYRHITGDYSKFKYYVPYGALDKVVEFINEFFGQTE